MSAKVTEAHRTKAHRIAEAVTSYFDAQDDCEFETNLIEDIAQALADAEQAATSELIEVLEDGIENSEMSLPRFEDPNYGDMVRNLGEQIGYGALMSSAAASWKKHHGSGAFCAGPCVGTAERWIAKARAAIARARGTPAKEKADG